MSSLPATQASAPAQIDAAYVQRILERDAHRLARASFLPDWLAKTNGQRRATEDIEADLMVIGQTAVDLGIPFNLVTLQKMPVIKGAADVMAQLLFGLVAARGHDAWVEERTMTKAVICLVNARTKRKHTIEYTIEEAKQTPQYASNPTWKTNPADMLVARAIRRAVRLGAPEVLMTFPQAFDEDDAQAGPDWQWQEEIGERPELPAPGVLDPAPDRTRRVDRLKKRIDALPAAARARLIDEWQARTIPPVQHPDFGARLDDAEDLVDEITAAAFALPPEATEDPVQVRDVPPTHVSPPEAGQGTDLPQSAPSRDEPARPLSQQIAMLADRAGVDRHNVIAAVTCGAKTSSKTLDAEEGELVIKALNDLAAGTLVLVEKADGWRFDRPRYAPGEEPFD